MNCYDKIINLEYQSVGIGHNNAKHISNVVMHILVMDMHTLFPLPCHILSKTYAFHVEREWPFHHTLGFVHYRFDLQVFQKYLRHDNNYECTILADIQHSHPQITLYWEVILLSWDERIFCNVESLMIILLSSSIAYFSRHLLMEDSPCYYEVIVQKLSITTLELIVLELPPIY